MSCVNLPFLDMHFYVIHFKMIFIKPTIYFIASLRMAYISSSRLIFLTCISAEYNLSNLHVFLVELIQSQLYVYFPLVFYFFINIHKIQLVKIEISWDPSKILQGIIVVGFR